MIYRNGAAHISDFIVFKISFLLNITFILCLLCVFRIQKATESLRTFHPASDPCFDEFVLDTSKEETLLKEMCFGGGTTNLFILSGGR